MTTENVGLNRFTVERLDAAYPWNGLWNRLKLSIPSSIDREEVLKQLDAVLDPELDESILALGMVKIVEANDSHLTVELELPTYWCAANFSYLMAIDARRNLLQVQGVESVTVRLPDHFASKTIEDGVNSAKSFADSFPGEAWDNLEQVRDLFLRKGYLGRQEKLLRQLINAGLSYEEISSLRSADVVVDVESCWVRMDGAEPVHVGSSSVARRYFERREGLGLDCSPTGRLMRDLRNQPIPAERLETYFAHSRTVRVSSEATGALCSVLLEARRASKGTA